MTDWNFWALIPTALAEHAAGTIDKWRAKGYKIGLFTDPVTAGDKPIPACDLHIHAAYPGVWRAWNALAKTAVMVGADLCFLVGDDMLPPEQDPQTLAREFFEHFRNGYGVMQGTGDKQGEIIGGKWNSQRICGSPVVGRLWIERAYNGHGPVNGKYHSFYADEELFRVAEHFGRLWQREDVTIWHNHWSWGHLPRQKYHIDHNKNHWKADKEIFDETAKVGFPLGEWY